MAGGRKRRPKTGPGHREELPAGRAEPGELPVLAEERRPEEARVVRPEGDRDPGAKEPEDRVARKGKRSRRGIRGQADVQRDARAGETPDEGGVGSRGDAVRDPAGLQPAERVGDGVGAADLAGVDDGGEAEPGKAAVDRGEVAGRKRELVPAEAEPDGARPGVARVSVEDPVGRVGAEVPHGVEEDADPAVPRPLVGGEDRLDRVPDGGPVEAEALHDRRGDVDLGVDGPLPAEPGRQVSREEGEVRGASQEPADVAVEREEAGQALEPAAGPDRGDVREERGPRPAGEPDERRGADGALQVEVQLGLGARAKEPEEVGHAHPSYGTSREKALSAVPSERLWLRAAAFGLDLICLAGGPLLVATVVVFVVVLFAAEPPAGLPRVFRVAQALFVLLFLLRDARGASPGKLLLGLSVHKADGRPAGPRESVLRNLPLLVPGLNVLEAAAVARRPDSRRSGDRLAGTTVAES